jgi:peroxiredoxin
MKIFRCYRVGLRLASLLSFAYGLHAQQNPARSQEAMTILRKMSAKLASLSRVSYHYRRELSYASEDYHHVLEADIFIEFDPKQQPVGAIYQAHDATGFEVYNGSEILRGVVATRTIQMSPVNFAKDLERVSFLYNSFLTLRLALPNLLADATIAKSVASRTGSNYEIDVRTPRAVLTATGTLSPITLPRDITYRITIDGKSFLPLIVRQTNNQNADFALVTFSNLNTNPAKMSADSWLYTSYRDYRLAVPGPTMKLLAVGSATPQWTLPLANGNGRTISLAEVLKDSSTKLVLLEFWISHCGYSIDAVAKLNALAKRFAPAGLTVLAVNPDDSEDTIRTFAKTYRPHYTLVADGGEITKQYGVGGYPTVLIVNAEGTILYAGGFDQEKLVDKIAALLK